MAVVAAGCQWWLPLCPCLKTRNEFSYAQLTDLITEMPINKLTKSAINIIMVVMKIGNYSGVKMVKAETRGEHLWQVALLLWLPSPF